MVAVVVVAVVVVLAVVHGDDGGEEAESGSRVRPFATIFSFSTKEERLFASSWTNE